MFIVTTHKWKSVLQQTCVSLHDRQTQIRMGEVSWEKKKENRKHMIRMSQISNEKCYDSEKISNWWINRSNNSASRVDSVCIQTVEDRNSVPIGYVYWTRRQTLEDGNLCKQKSQFFQIMITTYYFIAGHCQMNWVYIQNGCFQKSMSCFASTNCTVQKTRHIITGGKRLEASRRRENVEDSADWVRCFSPAQVLRTLHPLENGLVDRFNWRKISCLFRNEVCSHDHAQTHRLQHLRKHNTEVTIRWPYE